LAATPDPWQGNPPSGKELSMDRSSLAQADRRSRDRSVTEEAHGIGSPEAVSALAGPLADRDRDPGGLPRGIWAPHTARLNAIRLIAAVIVCAVLLLPGAALAQSSTCQVYNPQLCGLIGGTQPTGASASSVSQSGSLPFTGLDLLLLAVGGGALVVAGVVIRRLTSRAGEEPETPL
jgi:hypothetical protein